MMENMKINQLPSKTWNWLKMNETAISGITVSGAHEIKAEIPAGISKTNCPAGLPDQFREIAGGMGPDMDVLVRESAAGAVLSRRMETSQRHRCASASHTALPSTA